MMRGTRTRVFAGLVAALAVLLAGEFRTAPRNCLAKWSGAAAGTFVWSQDCSSPGAGTVGQATFSAIHGGGAQTPRLGLHPSERITVVALVLATAAALAQLAFDVSVGAKVVRSRHPQSLSKAGDFAEARQGPALPRLEAVGAEVRESMGGASCSTSKDRSPLGSKPSAKAVQLASRASAPSLVSRHLVEILRPTGGAAPRVPLDAALAASLRNGHLAATFERVEILAAGGFGLVCRALHRLEGTWYAVKLVPIRGLGADEDVGSRPELREVRSLKALADSRHVVRYHTAWCEEPWCLQGTLAGVSDAGETCGRAGGSLLRAGSSLLSSSTSRQASTRRAGSAASLADYAPTVQSSLGFVWEGGVSGDAGEAACSGAERGEAALPRFPQQPAAPPAAAPGNALTVVLLMQMELCDGTTLRSWVDSESRGRAPLGFTWGSSAEELPLELQFAEHLAKACREIHRAGLVHRDLKPSNIFVVRGKALKVGDFGLARPASEPQGRFEEQGVVGTPAYCAPEGGAHATAASDVFSMALVILEMLCPPMRTKMESAQVFEAFRERRELPRHIEENLPGHADLLRRMGSPNPEDRPSAAQAYATLKQLRSAGLALRNLTR